MAADPDSGGKTGRIRRVLATAVAVLGFVVTFAQLVEYLDSGKVRYIVSGIFTLIAVVGIVGLLSMKNRRNALTSAAVTLGIVVSTFGAIFFGYFIDHQLPGSARITENPSRSPSSSMAPNSVVPSADLPPLTNEDSSPLPLVSVTPNRRTQPPAGEPEPGDVSVPPPVPPVTRGAFTNPFNGQDVSGQSLISDGTIENYSSTLLCIVRDESGNYFPYAAPSANGRWNADVGIGPQFINRPLPFTLILATANQPAVDEIRRQQQSKPDYNTKGLGPNLPSGIGILAEIGVFRTS